MTTPEFVGIGLIAVSFLHLIPAITTGEIPARWPFAPLTKETQPQHYKVTFAVFSLAAAAGAILLAASLLVRLIHYLQGV
jgi:hypothetical protein